MRRVYTWVAFLMAVWLPLQAVAVPLLAACCPDRESGAAAEQTPCHEHAAPGASAAAAHFDGAVSSADREGVSPDNPSHVCCPHYAGAPVHRFDVAESPTRFAPPLLAVSARSHVPEQPQRPPRS